jgi:DNA repair ATPase RecN|tara:strand:- start:312 stop:665 length:354 start_codon:yes stop_codon:yes gene_type:complete
MKTEEVIVELLKEINAKINHIEDISADNRSVIVKLVKQSNSIVKFLQQIDITMEDVTEDYMSKLSTTEKNLDEKYGKFKDLKELVKEYMDTFEDLKEFEEELRKNKDKLTPGQVGES